ncbi:Hypothetical protein POVR2_LOCUS381 [uncultured virus]|nr:Hypothetical protein POVR2_LOCUS381 [uncultured virus]
MLDNKSLFTIYLDSAYRSMLQVILSSNTYWHSKTEYIVGKQLLYRPLAIWKSVYHTLCQDEEQEDIDDLDMVRYGVVNNLHSLQAVLDATGQAMNRESLHEYMSSTSSLEVFDYLLQHSRATKVDFYDVLISQLQLKDSTAIVDKILTLLPEDIDPTALDVSELLQAAVQYRPDVFEKFSVYIDNDVDMDTIFEEAIAADNVTMYNRLLTSYEVDTSELLEDIVSHGALNICKTYLAENEVSQSELLQLFPAAMSNEEVTLLAYMHSLVEPDWYSVLLDTDHTLEYTKICSQYAVSHVPASQLHSLLLEQELDTIPFLAVLSDSRYDPNQYAAVLVELPRVPYGAAYNLLHDPRVRIADMTDAALDKMLTCLSVDRDVEPTEIASYSIYTRLSNYILYGSPTAIHLLEWMVALRNPDIARAAASVLDSKLSYSQHVAPIRALLISLLYPQLSLLDAVRALIAEGYRAAALVQSIVLLASWSVNEDLSA